MTIKIQTNCSRCGITIFRSKNAIKARPIAFCKKCLQQNKVETMIKRYGSLEKAYQLRTQKTKKSNLQKYGTENPWALHNVGKKDSTL